MHRAARSSSQALGGEKRQVITPVERTVTRIGKDVYVGALPGRMLCELPGGFRVRTRSAILVGNKTGSAARFGGSPGPVLFRMEGS